MEYKAGRCATAELQTQPWALLKTNGFIWPRSPATLIPENAGPPWLLLSILQLAGLPSPGDPGESLHSGPAGHEHGTSLRGSHRNFRSPTGRLPHSGGQGAFTIETLGTERSSAAHPTREPSAPPPASTFSRVTLTLRHGRGPGSPTKAASAPAPNQGPALAPACLPCYEGSGTARPSAGTSAAGGGGGKLALGKEGRASEALRGQGLTSRSGTATNLPPPAQKLAVSFLLHLASPASVCARASRIASYGKAFESNLLFFPF